MIAGNRVVVGQGGGVGLGRKGAGVSRSNFESRRNRIGDWLKAGVGDK